MGALEDLLHRIVPTFGLEGEELRTAREELADGWMTIFLKGLDEILERGGEYFAANQLTVADLKVAGITKWLNSGQLDHIPTGLIERVAPALVEHEQRVSAHPVVTTYYEARSQ
jgi:glutathione S-transferase